MNETHGQSYFNLEQLVKVMKATEKFWIILEILS